MKNAIHLTNILASFSKTLDFVCAKRAHKIKGFRKTGEGITHEETLQSPIVPNSGEYNCGYQFIQDTGKQ